MKMFFSSHQPLCDLYHLALTLKPHIFGDYTLVYTQYQATSSFMIIHHLPLTNHVIRCDLIVTPHTHELCHSLTVIVTPHTHESCHSLTADNKATHSRVMLFTDS